MLLKPDETDLIGRWVLEENRVLGDPMTERIERLVSDYLEEIADVYYGWEILYRDPQDGRYWELTYPQSAMHGGGPPRLTCLPKKQAVEKYHLSG